MCSSDLPDGCCDLARTLRRTRRRAVQAGAVAAAGLTLDGLWAARKSPAGSTTAGFGKAKRCIFMFMWGGPSQLDTWDLKPDAPVEIRGEFRPIAASVPGTMICEHFPRLARLADRYAVVRSMTHEDTAHLSSAHHVLTGHHAPRRFSDATPPSTTDWPQLGSAISRLRPPAEHLPGCVTKIGRAHV